MNRLVYILVLAITCCLFACSNDLAEINKVIGKKDIRVESARDVELLYSDSAIVRVKVSAPLMVRHLDNNEPRSEFPEGVRVDFFGPRAQPEGFLVARYAIKYDDAQEFIARDSVVWNNLKNEKLETSELIWNEKTRKVHSKKFSKITRPGDIIYTYGFEADQDFTHWKTQAVEGKMQVKALSEETEQ